MNKFSTLISILFSLTTIIGVTPRESAAAVTKEVKLKNLNFVDGTINARTSVDFKPGSAVVLGIPGGPGIPGRYMDLITTELARKVGAVPVIIDLPNHGLSTRLNTAKPMTYPEAKQMLQSLLKELAASGSTVILFGHSLGALIALDLLHSQVVPILKTILVGMPIEFERNPAFTRFLRDSSAPSFSNEQEFEIWWRRVLPAYFYLPPSQKDVELLAESTSWFANEQFTTDLPPASATVPLLSPSLMKDLILIEGEDENILPFNNFNRLAAILPTVEKAIIPKAGHFPMLENPHDLLNEVTRHITHCNELLTLTSVNNK